MLKKKELIEILSKKSTANRIESSLNFNVDHNNKNVIVNDVLQETYSKALKFLNKYDTYEFESEAKFVSWLILISTNSYIDYLRKEARSKERSFGHLHEVLPHISDTEDNTEYTDDMMKDINKVIKTLPREQQEVIEYVFYKNYSYKEIVEETGVGINTWLGRMRYALTNIKKQLITV